MSTDDWYDEDEYDDEGNLLEPCFACGTPGCPGYCHDHTTYNLRPEETGGDPDEDGHQRWKDDLAQGLINPDGSQRDPDPPDGDPVNEPWVRACLDTPRTGDGGTDDPWALPEGETYGTESPF